MPRYRISVIGLTQISDVFEIDSDNIEEAETEAINLFEDNNLDAISGIEIDCSEEITDA